MFVQMTATAKAFISGLNVNQFVPNLQKKHLERQITTTKQHLPDYSVVSFNTASRCQQYSRAKHVLSAWQLSDKCHWQQVATVLALSNRSTMISTAVVF
jgi:hypothetical protein